VAAARIAAGRTEKEGEREEEEEEEGSCCCCCCSFSCSCCSCDDGDSAKEQQSRAQRGLPSRRLTAATLFRMSAVDIEALGEEEGRGVVPAAPLPPPPLHHASSERAASARACELARRSPRA
jgi:hypothetical protein